MSYVTVGFTKLEIQNGHHQERPNIALYMRYT